MRYVELPTKFLPSEVMMETILLTKLSKAAMIWNTK